MINILISKTPFFEQRTPLKCQRRPSWGQTLFLRRSSLPMIRSAATSAHVESKQRVRPAPKHTPSLPQKHSLPPRGLSRCTAPKHRFRMSQNAVFVPQKTPLATVCHGMLPRMDQLCHSAPPHTPPQRTALHRPAATTRTTPPPTIVMRFLLLIFKNRIFSHPSCTTAMFCATIVVDASIARCHKTAQT